MRIATAGAIGLAALLLSSTAMADNWTATKLRGGVFVFIDGGWSQIARGTVVPDGTVLRTQGNGRVTLVRGAESVAVGPDSQIEVIDRDGEKFTTVKQWYGTVEVEAERRNVAHFAVRTQQIAAVVKGTKFRVSSDGGDSEVDVIRGQVEVSLSTSGDTVSVGAGQSVSTDDGDLMPVTTPASNRVAPVETPAQRSENEYSPDNWSSGGDSAFSSPQPSVSEPPATETPADPPASEPPPEPADEHDADDFVPDPGKVKHDHDGDGVADH